MTAENLWLALALALMIEGLFPLVSPRTWRKTFTQLLGLQDGQLRFFGLLAVGLGGLMWWALG